MTYRSVEYICLFVGLISSSSVLARADERYTVSEHAEAPKVRADKALVYFVVPGSRGFRAQKIYIDKHPIGVVPGNSYTATLVEPGLRLIWGSQRGEWFEFRPGKTYLLDTRGTSADTFLQPPEWFLEHPAAIAHVEKSELKYVQVTEVGVEKLREKLDHNYEEARRQAGNPIPVTLPISFQIKVKVAKPGSKDQGGNFGFTSGTLTIEQTRIRFASKRANKLAFDIPIEDVYGVKLLAVRVKSWDEFGKKVYSHSEILTKSYGVIHLVGKEPFGVHNRRFQSIMKALESCVSCSGVLQNWPPSSR